MTEQGVLSVTQLNTYIKSLFESDKLLNGIYIKGEISNFTNHYKSGHFYFTLKDEQSSIKAVMFSRYASGLRFLPQNGMQVIVQCSVSVYERDGVYQIYVYDIQPLGLGSLQLAYEQLRNKLELEGLFDNKYKKQIPYMPQTIAVVTSATGAVLHDIINILTRRFPLVTVKVYSVTVQGSLSANEICNAINAINITNESDVIIIARGGGSLEDLWVFNEEIVARTVFASKIPVISAIGHETDYTICDFVSDLRAPTPTAAAELAVPNIDDIIYRISVIERELNGAVICKINNIEAKLQSLKSASEVISPTGFINNKLKVINDIDASLSSFIKSKIESDKNKLAYFGGIVDANNPIKALLKGYSITKINNETIKSINDVDINNVISTNFSDGTILSRVISIDKNIE